MMKCLFRSYSALMHANRDTYGQLKMFIKTVVEPGHSNL